MMNNYIIMIVFCFMFLQVPVAVQSYFDHGSFKENMVYGQIITIFGALFTTLAVVLSRSI